MNDQIRNRTQNGKQRVLKNNQCQLSHKGITLIALIITIVVLIILATVSIQAISGEGILGKAREAAFKAEMAQLQEDLGLFVAEKQLENKGEFNVNTLSASADNAYYEGENGEPKDLGNIDNVLPSLKGKRRKQIEIIKGELLFASQDDHELTWAEEMGICTNPWNIVDGVLMSSKHNLDLMGEDGVLAIPTSVTKIAKGAFAKTNIDGDGKVIKKVIIPGNVKEIEANAFSNNPTLETVMIEDGVQIIGQEAFRGCSSLRTVEMSDSVVSIRWYVFFGV